MADDWARCEICGDRMKADRLPHHVEEVHPEGAASDAERAQVEDRRERRRKINLAAAGVLAVAALVAGGWALTQLGGPTETTLADDDDPRVGSPDANLTVYLFEDYQCPHCADFETQGGFDHLHSTWVEPGEVRVVFKDFPIVGEDSTTAAEASQCVWENNPDAWLDWHHHVFANQGQPDSGWADDDGLVALARDHGGVDAGELQDCLDSGRYREEVQADREQGEANGVPGTPSLVVGDRVVNPRDTETVDDAIRDALSEED